MKDFIITDHAYERINERFMWSKKKIKKLIAKAYKSGEEVPQIKIRENSIQGRELRKFLGYIWVFKDDKLLTLYKL
mgnify:CR=1 FL=1